MKKALLPLVAGLALAGAVNAKDDRERDFTINTRRRTR
jgi:hypothetical protein